MRRHIAANLNMQQVRSNRDSPHESIPRGVGSNVSSNVVRTDLSSLVNDYTSSQRHCMIIFFFRID